MSTIASTDTRRYPPRKLALLAAIGAIVGGALGYAGPSLLRQFHVSPRSLGWTDLLAMWIGTVFIGYAFLFGALSTNRRQLARILEGEQATVPATRQEVSTTRLQTLVLLLAGLLLMLPIFAQNVITGRPALGAELFAAIVILFAVQTWATFASGAPVTSLPGASFLKSVRSASPYARDYSSCGPPPSICTWFAPSAHGIPSAFSCLSTCFPPPG